MIRYADALDDLDAAIDAVSATWRTRAEERTAIYQTLGRYTEDVWIDPATGAERSLSPFWSEIKSVYMRRQFNKCIYCEKKLEGGSFATVEWDLEHFRPKGRIRLWMPKRGIDTSTKYDFPLGDASPIGYFLLAYHRHNYAAACKTCNSTFKSDYFPVAANRLFAHLLPADYDSELPYLPYALGNRGDAPESLIGFVGAIAVPRFAEREDLYRYRRGCVTIDFFGLNRDGLIHERAWWLRNAVWETIRNADSAMLDAVERLALLRMDRAPFANCSRCFIDLCRDDRPAAEAMIPVFDQVLAMEI